MPSGLKGQKTKWIVTVEIEMEVSDEQAIESGTELVRKHFQPRNLGFGSGRDGWYSARSTRYKLSRA